MGETRWPKVLSLAANSSSVILLIRYHMGLPCLLPNVVLGGARLERRVLSHGRGLFVCLLPCSMDMAALMAVGLLTVPQGASLVPVQVSHKALARGLSREAAAQALSMEELAQVPILEEAVLAGDPEATATLLPDAVAEGEAPMRLSLLARGPSCSATR